MALRIRFQYVTGMKLGYSVERLSDGYLWDATNRKFQSAPGLPISNLTESTSPFQGLYRDTIASTPVTEFSNGHYAIAIHRRDNANQVISVLMSSMVNGDDNSVVSGSTGNGGIDVSAVAQGVWEYSTAKMTVNETVGKLVRDHLDATVSSRSTYDGGPVQSVIEPVVVKSNQDKTGYTLAAGGLDAIIIEQGINARQALSPILAATAGVISGASTGQISIRGGNSATTRIQATTDDRGNRVSVTLNLPS